MKTTALVNTQPSLLRRFRAHARGAVALLLGGLCAAPAALHPAWQIRNK